MLKKMGAVLLILAAGLSLAACSTRAPAEEIVLYYESGVKENKKFKECIEPGTSGPGVVDDETFYLPTSLRTWKVAPGSSDFDGVFVVGSAPDKKGQAGPQMHIKSTIDFYLNTNCGKDGKDKSSPVVQFWEKTGRRYGVATKGEGNFQIKEWKLMLQDTMHAVEEGLLQEQARKYDDDALDTNASDTWGVMERDMASKFNEQLRKKVGGEYFCGTSYDRTSGVCPDVFVDILGIDYADPGIQVARNDVRKAEEAAKAELVRAQAEVDKANLLAAANRNPGYLEYARLETALEIARLNYESAKACAANPNCTLVIGVGSGVTNLGINTGK